MSLVRLIRTHISGDHPLIYYSRSEVDALRSTVRVCSLNMNIDFFRCLIKLLESCRTGWNKYMRRPRMTTWEHPREDIFNGLF